MPTQLRLRLAIAAFALAGVWLAYGFSREIYRTLDLEVLRPDQARPAILWRPSTPQARRLHAFLDRALEIVPPGSRVGFATEPSARFDGFFRFLWAAYWFPGRKLIPDNVPAAQSVEYWVTFRRQLEQPGLELVFEQGPGRLYRTAKSGEAR
jgi:hypothetical protein